MEPSPPRPDTPVPTTPPQVDPYATVLPIAGEVRPATTEAVPGYVILGELGRGGMGVVYRARQVALNRVVALKMMRIAEAVHAAHQAGIVYRRSVQHRENAPRRWD